MTCEDEVVFDSPQWANYSMECQDLISRLLIKRPEERITLIDALAHNWFRKVRAKYEKNETASPRSPLRNARVEGRNARLSNSISTNVGGTAGKQAESP